MTVKLFDANNGELMEIRALERDGDKLVVRGKIYGSMPMSAYLCPEEFRKSFGLLSAKQMFFLFTLLFRKSRTAPKKP